MIKVQAELISCRAYTDKKTGEPKTRIGYRLLENKYRLDAKTVKGFAELAIYTDTHKVFDILKPEYFGVNVELEIDESPSTVNPLRSVQIVKSIKVGENNVISLL